ncbi:Crp/Fnr family transcriptional regulator [Vibrio natriegens]|jgi:CRP-like cAMP-binding protein|uniref:Crp/Fnr family transcriptional regulator n=1 Tax=Vibrio natriegens TaxID=691 RepID=UPI00080479D1|nr:Crp/Fnr family transcriptional regulator [Vibrio natriegens]ANQ15968.1 Crp/Fnr family transcriptional regulator [Vibrio natriegens]MCY9875159.1 Crp/Fnr family transcriptional regulator [Vibrio natriegens]
MPNDVFSDLTKNGFSEQEAAQLIEHGQELELPTRHILCNQGEFGSHIYFILEGLCHASYLTEQGKEFSKEFYWEKDWVIGFESVINNQPSLYLLETLTACRLFCLPIETLHRWRSDKHSIYLKLLETQLLNKEHKERFMLLYSPEERYQLFCQHYPDLEQRITDSQIAAYLGITAISLSRIKARLAKDNQ